MLMCNKKCELYEENSHHRDNECLQRVARSVGERRIIGQLQLQTSRQSDAKQLPKSCLY